MRREGIIESVLDYTKHRRLYQGNGHERSREGNGAVERMFFFIIIIQEVGFVFGIHVIKYISLENLSPTL